MFSLIGRSLSTKSFKTTTPKVSVVRIAPKSSMSCIFTKSAPAAVSRSYATYSSGRNGDIKNVQQQQQQPIQEEQPEEDYKPATLAESLGNDISEIEANSELSIPESFKVTRDGDTVILDIAQEGTRTVTVTWNVNDGPNFTEFVTERHKKEEEEQKEKEREERGAEESEEGQDQQQQQQDEQFDEPEDRRDIVITVTMKNNSNQKAEFKCTVSKDATIFLDSITIGTQTLDDIFSLNENTIEHLFGFLEEHGIDENFGGFVQSYNVTRKLKANFNVVRQLSDFLKKE